MRWLIILWGVLGVELILVRALTRVGAMAVDAFAMPLTTAHWLFLVPWVGFMAYSEGYRGFQQRFAPRVVARAWHLSRAPRALHLLLAPLFCIGYFHASRRRMLTSWLLTIGIVGIVMAVRLLPQPWRGLVDFGVVVGLAWGALAIAVLAVRAALAGGTSVDPQLPDGVASMARSSPA